MTNTEKRGLRVLVLDGGGVRGLSELLILEQLMPIVEEESANQHTTTLRKPCEVFDIICGTSTGGLVAILLGCLKLTVKEAIVEYENLSKEIFGAPKSKKPGRESKYSATTFEQVIKRLVKKYTNNEDTAILQDEEGQCKVFVCTQRALAIDKNNPFLMRSYPDSTNVDGLTLWQAARATSAAPTFFKRLKIGTREYIDGGIGCNNPSRVLLKELQRIYRRDPSHTVSCIINIGTGIPKDLGLEELTGTGIGWLLDVAGTLKSMATDCEAIAEDMASIFKNTQNFYFRFNVEQGLQDISLDNFEKLNVVRAKTEKYLAKDVQQNQLLQAAKAVASNRTGSCLISELRVPIAGNQSQTPIQQVELSSFPPQNTSFFGRQKELTTMNDMLGGHHNGKRVLVVWGFPGLGKTAIALQYVKLHKHEYKHILWINASTEASAMASFSEVAFTILSAGNSPDTFENVENKSLQICKQWLERKVKDWLMVIDGADNLEKVDIRTFLPLCDHGAVLITSSRYNLGSSLRVKEIALRDLDEQSGVNLLISTWRRTTTVLDEEHESALAVVKILNSLPLAIEQAGVLLRRGYPLSNLPNLLSEKMDWAMKQEPKPVEWGYNRKRGLFTILEILYDQLVDSEPTAPSALFWISVLGPGEISVRALGLSMHRAVEHKDFDMVFWADSVGSLCIDQESLNGHLMNLVKNPEKLWSAIFELEDSCIIKSRRDSSGAIASFWIHDTVRDWSIRRAKHVTDFSLQNLPLVSLFAAYVLSQNFSDIGEEHSNFMSNQKLTISTQNILSLLEMHLDQNFIQPGEPFSSVYRYIASHFASHFIGKRQHRTSVRLLQDVLAYEISLQGSSWPKDEKSLRLMEAMGDCHAATGHFKDAEIAYIDLLGHSMQILGEMEQLTLDADDKLRNIKNHISRENRSLKQATNKTNSSPSGSSSSAEKQIVAKDSAISFARQIVVTPHSTASPDALDIRLSSSNGYEETLSIVIPTASRPLLERNHPVQQPSIFEVGNRQKSTKSLTKLGGYLNNPAYSRFGRSELEQWQALDFPEIPGEEYQNPELALIGEHYNRSRRRASRRRELTFMGIATQYTTRVGDGRPFVNFPGAIQEMIIHKYALEQSRLEFEQEFLGDYTVEVILRQNYSDTYFGFSIPLCIPQLKALSLDPIKYAREMGVLIAKLFWIQQLDGRSIKFALSPTESHKMFESEILGQHSLMASTWVSKHMALDENGVKQAASAYIDKWQLPHPVTDNSESQILWDGFKTEFLLTSQAILGGKPTARLPELWVTLVEESARAAFLPLPAYVEEAGEEMVS